MTATVAVGVCVALMKRRTVSRNPAAPGTFKRGTLARTCAVARDIKEIERQIESAARWAAKWRKLEEEALEAASAMRDPEARPAKAVYLRGLQASGRVVPRNAESD